MTAPNPNSNPNSKAERSRPAASAWTKPVLRTASVKDITRGNGISGQDGQSANPRS